MDDLTRLADLAEPAPPPPPIYLAAVRARRRARRVTLTASSLAGVAVVGLVVAALLQRPGLADAPRQAHPDLAGPISQPSLKPVAPSQPTALVASTPPAAPTLGWLMQLVRALPPGADIELPAAPGNARMEPLRLISPWRDPALLRELADL